MAHFNTGNFILSMVYCQVSHAFGGMKQTLNFRETVCCISPMSTGHNEKVFNPAVSCCTLSFPRVICETVFSFTVLSTVLSSSYSQHLLCKLN